MNKNKYLNNGHLREQFNIDRRLIAIVSIFAVTGIILLAIALVAANTLSSLRAFSSLQTHWTEQRKEIVYQLSEYIHTGEPEAWNQYRRSSNYIRNAATLRKELEKKKPDQELIHRYLSGAGIDSRDFKPMIKTYQRFHTFSDFAITIDLWQVSDTLVNNIDRLAAGIRKQMQNEGREVSKNRWLAELKQIDDSLTTVQYKLASSLGDGTRLLKDIIFWVSIGIGLILFVIGITFSVRFLRSIRKWHQSLEVNEQMYRSLFDHNPNAVYSINRKGEFMEGNKGLEEMTGYKVEELVGTSFEPLVVKDELEKVGEYFKKALNGEPQRYETQGKKKNGEILHAYVTNLPIYVDDAIVGVYGIAQDITARKEAEQKISEQLHEKNILLAEIHHRVKNNLALISSLLQLQEFRVDDPELVNVLEDTNSRIHSMAIIHEKLYQTELFSSINMQEYVEELVNSIHETFVDNTLKLEYEINIDDITLDINQAIPCGLLINELLLNVYKHAFHGMDKGMVRIEFVLENGNMRLSVEDNGSGSENGKKDSSLGTKLIETLTKQLSGELTYESNGGTKVDILLFAKDQ